MNCSKYSVRRQGHEGLGRQFRQTKEPSSWHEPKTLKEGGRQCREDRSNMRCPVCVRRSQAGPCPYLARQPAKKGVTRNQGNLILCCVRDVRNSREVREIRGREVVISTHPRREGMPVFSPGQREIIPTQERSKGSSRNTASVDSRRAGRCLSEAQLGSAARGSRKRGLRY